MIASSAAAAGSARVGSKTPGKQNISSCPGGKCAPGQRVCFTAGTLIEMCDGTHRAIETLEEGELVWAWDEATGESDCRPIAETFARGTEMLLALDIVDNSGQVEQITTTAEHPFYRPELGRFVRADELVVGDALLSSSGAWLKVGSATWVQQSATVYNLTVDEFHTYFVGLKKTLVHNQHCRNKQYIPEQPIKQQNVKDIDIPLPDPFAKGSPHTVLGKKIGTDDGVIYRQSATFPADTWPKANGQGVPLSRVDWHDHSLPQHHPNPHQHVYRYNWQQHRWEMGDPTPLF